MAMLISSTFTFSHHHDYSPALDRVEGRSGNSGAAVEVREEVVAEMSDDGIEDDSVVAPFLSQGFGGETILEEAGQVDPVLPETGQDTLMHFAG